MGFSEFIRDVAEYVPKLEEALKKLPLEYREKMERCRELMNEIGDMAMYLSFAAACGYRYEKDGLEGARVCVENMYETCVKYYRSEIEFRKKFGKKL